MLSKFEEVLPILEEPGLRLGVCAMGPVAEGDEISWMRVWVWQQDGTKIAASSGTSGEHFGAHPLAPSERLPFTPKEGWMIQTELEPGAEQFSGGKPALAMAMALVNHSDGTSDVEQWNQAVSVSGGHDH